MGRFGAVSQKRYGLIDSFRGFTLLSMLIYHLAYDIICIFGGNFDWFTQPWVMAWERSISFSFVVISGVSLNFSRHAYRHGLIVNACGLVITAVTAIVIPDQIIIFGILNCIGCSMIITRALRHLLERIEPFFGAVVSFFLFGFAFGLPLRYLGFFDVRLTSLPDWLYSLRPLAVLGLYDNNFFSADFFPLIPWLFLFFCGFFIWRAIEKAGKEKLFLFGVPALDFIGRYTLWIYLIHQPLFMGICFLIFGGI